jgi:hypothetical protein
MLINQRFGFILYVLLPGLICDQINTCKSEHDAVVRAAVRCTPGYSVTGTGLCVCARHCLVRKNGAGDLQKGEK